MARTAMGEYIVPSGGKPLTSLADSGPGPAEYLPKLESWKTTGPEYSIAGPYKPLSASHSAGPADYDISPRESTTRRSVPLGSKGETRPYGLRDKAHVTDGIGPGGYSPVGGNNSYKWEQGPSWSLKSRHKDGIHPGHPSKLVQPADTKRDPVPASNSYDLNSKYNRSSYKGDGRHYTMAGTHQQKHNETPGPADYDATISANEGQGKGMAGRLPTPEKDNDVPGPSHYNVPSYMGKGLAKTIGKLPPQKKAEFHSPDPTLYMIKRPIGGKQCARITWRPFSPEDKPKPGPTDYHLSDCHLRREPQWSMRSRTKPVFPDILHYRHTCENDPGETPGPGHYEQTARTLAGGKTTSITMGKRIPYPKHECPAPNQYSPAGRFKAPAFSFGTKTSVTQSSVGPGPGAYNLEAKRTNAGFTMSQRPVHKRKTETPAPNMYKPLDGQTSKGSAGGRGVSFKGRPSPFVYLGRKGTRLLEAS